MATLEQAEGWIRLAVREKPEKPEPRVGFAVELVDLCSRDCVAAYLDQAQAKRVEPRSRDW